MRLYRFWQPQQFPKCLKLIQLAVTYCIFLKAIIYYFTQQNKSATAVIVVVVTNILI